jgi:hypothetical protein
MKLFSGPDMDDKRCDHAGWQCDEYQRGRLRSLGGHALPERSSQWYVEGYQAITLGEITADRIAHSAWLAGLADGIIETARMGVDDAR